AALGGYDSYGRLTTARSVLCITRFRIHDRDPVTVGAIFLESIGDIEGVTSLIDSQGYRAEADIRHRSYWHAMGGVGCIALAGINDCDGIAGGVCDVDRIRRRLERDPRRQSAKAHRWRRPGFTHAHHGCSGGQGCSREEEHPGGRKAQSREWMMLELTY